MTSCVDDEESDRRSVSSGLKLVSFIPDLPEQDAESKPKLQRTPTPYYDHSPETSCTARTESSSTDEGGLGSRTAAAGVMRSTDKKHSGGTPCSGTDGQCPPLLRDHERRHFVFGPGSTSSTVEVVPEDVEWYQDIRGTGDPETTKTRPTPLKSKAHRMRREFSMSRDDDEDIIDNKLMEWYITDNKLMEWYITDNKLMEWYHW